MNRAQGFGTGTQDAGHETPGGTRQVVQAKENTTQTRNMRREVQGMAHIISENRANKKLPKALIQTQDPAAQVTRH